MGRIDVLSPNHEEAAGFLSVAKSDIDGMEARSSIRTLLLNVLYSKALLAKVEKLPVICIRSGALGALVSCNREEAIWVDAYHEKQEADRVVDVTGGGNSWLGGFAASLASRPEGKWSIKEVEQAAQKGSVSASFIIEQQSLPSFAYNSQGVELWNHEQAYTRLHHLQNRTPLESQL
jgi:sugar/nucleoside kinase (ribokinase family)